MSLSMARVRRSLQERTSGAGAPDSGVAILAALITIMILTALSVLVLGIMLSQVSTTHFAQKNTRTIFAAEAGVEATLGKIRTVAGAADFTGKTFGDPRQLPVLPDGCRGHVLLRDDVLGRGAVLRREPRRQGRHVARGKGPDLHPWYRDGHGAAGLRLHHVHGQATASARVRANQADRGISMVYQFQTTTTNIKGGRIWSWQRLDVLPSGGRAHRRVDSVVPAGDQLRCVGERHHRAVGLRHGLHAEAGQLDDDRHDPLPDERLEPAGHHPAQGLQHGVDHPAVGVAPNGNATWQAQDTLSADNSYCLSSSQTTGSPIAGSKLKVVKPCANKTAGDRSRRSRPSGPVRPASTRTRS